MGLWISLNIMNSLTRKCQSFAAVKHGCLKTDTLQDFSDVGRLTMLYFLTRVSLCITYTRMYVCLPDLQKHTCTQKVSLLSRLHTSQLSITLKLNEKNVTRPPACSTKLHQPHIGAARLDAAVEQSWTKPHVPLLSWIILCTFLWDCRSTHSSPHYHFT